MLRRGFAVFMTALGVALAVPAVASAHVLKVDGDIGGVLHINPDDNPTTGGSTDFIISFDDDTGKFNLLKCTCSVAIMRGGQTVATQSLAFSSRETSEDHYTFTKPGPYTLRFSGKPKTPGAFQPFTLNYPVRVTSGQPNPQPVPAALWVGIGLIIALILLAAIATSYDSGA